MFSASDSLLQCVHFCCGRLGSAETDDASVGVWTSSSRAPFLAPSNANLALVARHAQTITQEHEATCASSRAPLVRTFRVYRRPPVRQLWTAPSSSGVQPVPVPVWVQTARTIPSHPHSLPEECSQASSRLSTSLGRRSAAVRSARRGRTARRWDRGWRSSSRRRVPGILERSLRKAEARSRRSHRRGRLLRLPVSRHDLDSLRGPDPRRPTELTTLA